MCFIQFENMNVYYGSQHKVKYKAPTDHCFVLKVMYKKKKKYLLTQILANSKVFKFKAPRSLMRFKKNPWFCRRYSLLCFTLDQQHIFTVLWIVGIGSPLVYVYIVSVNFSSEQDWMCFQWLLRWLRTSGQMTHEAVIWWEDCQSLMLTLWPVLCLLFICSVVIPVE